MLPTTHLRSMQKLTSVITKPALIADYDITLASQPLRVDGSSFVQTRLTNANLKGTTFKKVELFQSDLYGAKFEQTRFIGCAATNLITNDRGLDNLAYLIRTTLLLNGCHTTQPSDLQKGARCLRLPLTYIPHCVIS